MRNAKNETGQNQQVKELNVAGRLTIWGAGDLKELLLREMGTSSDLVLQMADNDEIDMAGAQVLLAARQSAMACSQQLVFPEELPESIQIWLGRAALSIQPGE